MSDIFCKNEEKTKDFGQMLGLFLQTGDVLCLVGDLGAGKTCLAKAIATALGVKPEEVTSPTFSIMNIYQGNALEIKHFDLYRLNSSAELDDIGFSEYAGNEGVTLIEWGELFAEEMPEEHLVVKIIEEDAGRRILLEPHGKHYEELCEKVWLFVNSRD